MRLFGFLILFGLVLLACNKKVGDAAILTAIDSDYEKQILQYRAEREAELRKPTGWLSLVGLHWLDEGMNSFGGADDNRIILSHTDTETIGAYQKTDDEIFFGKVEGIEVLDDRGQPYLGGPVEVAYPYTEVSHQSLYWQVIQRGDRYGLRLKDTLAETRLNFKGIDFYEPDEKYKFDAIVETTNDSISITNVLGETSLVPVAAYLSFDIAEHYYSFAALDEGGDTYFLVFSDESTGAETYGGGRFLYPDKPCATCPQRTVLDFNKAQNPPCAYTDFATCPLPPSANRLKIRVLAGEKYVDPQ